MVRSRRVHRRETRPTRFAFLCVYPLKKPQGDCTKAKKELGWVPEITFTDLVKDMMQADIANVDAGNDHL